MKWAKDIWGRPTKMNEETVKKLLDAFSYGFTDIEACVYADISRETLYAYIRKNPSFSDTKEALKNKPQIKAKMNIVWAINKWELNDSKWYLERKSRDEFSLKQEVEQKGEMTLTHKNISSEEAEAMSEYERNERRKEIINWSNK